MSVELVCTDGDTHPVRNLGTIGLVRPWSSHGPVGPAELAFWPRPGADPVVEQRFQVRCPTCRRTVPMRPETARAVLDTPRLTGQPIDVSML